MRQQQEGPDGGITALAGFLYQTIGTIGLAVSAFQQASDDGAVDLETLLGIEAAGEIHYEHFDQDATIQEVFPDKKHTGYMLIQFKYSRVRPERAITPTELKKIATRLQVSEKRANDLGQSVTRYVLLTNRPLSETALPLINPTGTATNAHPKKTTSIPDILQRLQVIKPISHEIWEHAIQEYASNHGCLEHEIKRGLHECIGQLTLRASTHGSTLLTKEDLLFALTSNRQARPLLPANIAKHCQAQLTDLAERRQFEPDQRQLVRRDLLTQLSHYAETHALIALTGSGGNGKTVALWHWIEESLHSLLPQKHGVYYALVAAEDADNDCLGEQLHAWAQLPLGHSWRAEAHHHPESVLLRLQAARRDGKHPLLLLGVDAVDEVLLANSRPGLRSLLRWFWQEGKQAQREHRLPQATAIITCRDYDTLTREWLEITSHFGHLQTEQNILAHVDVSRFSDQELLAAAQHNVPDLAERFLETISPIEQRHGLDSRSDLLSPTLPEFIELLQPGASSDPPPLIAPEVFQSLHHPVLWQCLLLLDPLQQARALDGASESLARLAAFFTHWFCTKAKRRGYHLDIPHLVEVIGTIAHQCSHQISTYHTRAQWLEAIHTTGLMSDNEARSFFDEALSAGLINYDGNNRWYWCHPFICDHLLASTGVPNHVI
jgi:hypothetical protein